MDTHTRVINVSNIPRNLVTVVTPAGFEHFVEETGLLVDNITDFSPPVDYQFDENRILKIAAKYVLQLK